MSRDPAFQMAGQAALLTVGVANALSSITDSLLSFPQHDNRYSVREVMSYTQRVNKLISGMTAKAEANEKALIEEAEERREADAERIIDLETARAAWQNEALRLRAELAALQAEKAQTRRPAVSISAYRPGF